MFKTNKGFTLIELLVVIAIIGLLSSVVLASLNSARSKARDARRVADIQQLRTALELYYDSNRTYPVVSAAAVGSNLDALKTGAFIPAIPTDPTGTVSYWYAGSATTYCLGVTLENTGNLPASGNGSLCTGVTGNYKVSP
ncbi:prepilin-type N-terminal cleavage/methylation domain-containing protein [Candidatus Parcubacteria bacterium]|nr:prepilin-type N-terminal cleavage/methylation domain-containing protein [Candidatus Parcubacteria bacterium]